MDDIKKFCNKIGEPLMFEKFLNYVEYDGETSFSDIESFNLDLNTKSFKNGIYRLFDKVQCEKWKDIVEKSFPKYVGIIDVFAYDWLGRIFAMNKNRGTVLLFEPGAGEVMDIPVNFVEFHDVEIAEYHNDTLASDFFNEWFSKSDNYILKNTECVGYKVPLFLDGDDDIDNVEVSDMDVYWELMKQLMKL